MIISRGYIWCKVQATPNEEGWLHRALSVPVSYYYRGRYRTKLRRLYSKRTKQFAAGLLDRCLKLCAESSVKVQVIEHRSRPAILPSPPECEHLFYYQKDAVEAVLKQGNGILKHATGAGKTEVAVTLACRVDGNTLFLVDEKALREQARDRWRKITKTPAGVIVGSNFDPRRFTVATLQTLYHRLANGSIPTREFLKSVRCVIFDEGHILGAQTYWKVAMSVPAYFRIALTATPTGRSDQKDAYVIGATGPVIHEVTTQELVDFGRLAVSDVIFYKPPGTQELNTRGWHKTYDKGIVENRGRNRTICRICRIAPLPALLFVERKRHGYILKDMLLEYGFDVEFVWGTHKSADRRKYIRRLNSGRMDILICSKIFNKGVDIPNIRSGINAAGMKGKIPTVQKAGRVMRVGESKTAFVFFDFIDTHHATLLKHSRKRYRQYTREGMNVRIVQSLREIREKPEEQVERELVAHNNSLSPLVAPVRAAGTGRRVGIGR